MTTPFNSTDKVILSFVGVSVEPIAEFTYEEAKQMIGEVAFNLNCGLTRTWFVNGIEYWDCGPRVFSIVAAE